MSENSRRTFGSTEISVSTRKQAAQRISIFRQMHPIIRANKHIYSTAECTMTPPLISTHRKASLIMQQTHAYKLSSKLNHYNSMCKESQVQSDKRHYSAIAAGKHFLCYKG